MKVSRYLRTYERMGRKLAYEKFVLWNDEVIDTTKQQTYIELEERGSQFGDGVYEVIRLYKGNFHLLDPHNEIISIHGRSRIIAPFLKS